MAKGITIARLHLELEKNSEGIWYVFTLDENGNRPHSHPTSAVPGSGGIPASSYTINLWKDLVEAREKVAVLKARCAVLEKEVKSK